MTPNLAFERDAEKARRPSTFVSHNYAHAPIQSDINYLLPSG